MNDREPELVAGFADLADEVKVVDLTARVHTASRRLARRRAITSAVAAVAVLGMAGLGTLAVTNPKVLQETVAGIGPSSSPSASPAPAPPSAPPSEAPQPSIGPPNVKSTWDGRIPAAELRDATLDVPAWGAVPCPSGKLKFSGGYHATGDRFGTGVTIVTDPPPLFADIDGGGKEQETVIRLSCAGEGHRAQQVLALDRVSAGGAIITLGQVAVNRDPATAIDLIEAAGTTVRVRFSAAAEPVWRVYRWVGTRFTQIDGPTGTPTPPDASRADLGIAVGDINLSVIKGATPEQDSYGGTVTINLQNRSAFRSGPIRIALALKYTASPKVVPQRGDIRHDNGCLRADSEVCEIGPLDGNGSRTVTLYIISNAAPEKAARVWPGAITFTVRSMPDNDPVKVNNSDVADAHLAGTG